METIKVNMNPNPLDVQTIHASQNDGEARQWGFELHNNGDVIDSSEITDQITFKAYTGGTEEILPSALYNGSVDLGSLTWEYISEIPIYQATITDGKFTRGQDLPCDMYSNSGVMSSTNMPNMTYQILDNGTLWIKNTSYSSADSFKNAMQGVNLWYQKSDSTPTTTPIDADIKYPQGLLADQVFTYRESPTESDGLAKITEIKGNTLVWNQLVQNTSATWFSNSNTQVSVSFDANTNTATITGLQGNTNGRGYTIVQTQQNHKYLVCGTIKTSVNGYVFIEFSRGWVGKQTQVSANTETYISFIVTPTSATDTQSRMQASMTQNGEYVLTCKNMMCIDLTQMGLDITDPSDFTSLFSLPYYSYNQGSLLSFNGNGIKTTGKNLLSYSGENLPYNANGVSITREDNIYKVVATNPSGYPFARISTIHYLPKGRYTVTMLGAETSSRGIAWRLIDRNVSPVNIFVNASETTTTFTLNEDAHDVYFEITIDASKLTAGTWDVRFQLNMGTPSDYEPYTETTTSLPISTYFPTGMKSAGTAYDELTESKAITRIGSVDLGTLSWNWQSTWQAWYTYQISVSLKGASNNDTKPNIVSANYPTLALNSILGTSAFGISVSNVSSGNKLIAVENGSDTVTPTGYLYYELATPTETSFSTASLVTENAEIPLSNEDGVLIGKCTEQLSAEPGFHDAKIKLSDADGECYSNKLQLHVERSPQ